MSAKQQVVFCTEKEPEPDYWTIFDSRAEDVEYVRNAIDGEIEDIIETAIQLYSVGKDYDIGIAISSIINDAVSRAVEDEVGE